MRTEFGRNHLLRAQNPVGTHPVPLPVHGDGMKSLRRLFPRGLRRRAKEMTLDKVDALLRLAAGGRDLPPLSLRDYVGGSEGFEELGPYFLGEFRRHGLIRSGQTVLDVGCGSGRITRALAADPELGHTIRYVGMDIDQKAVAWCRRRFSKSNPAFSFYAADLFNRAYNPKGTIRPEEFVFPHPDAEFDFILLIYVFTNFAPEGMANYFSELRRILKPGGSLYLTLFLYDTQDEAVGGVARRLNRFPFFHGHYAVKNEELPENAIAYQKGFILELAHSKALTLREPVLEGFLDTVILQRA